MGTLTVSSSDGSSAEVEIKRPKFMDLWQAYLEVGNKNYLQVYNLIGGRVLLLQQEQPANYTNACALRMSRAFNYGGFSIPRGTIIKNKNIYRVAGSDNLPYIMRVKDIILFIEYNWGKPEFDIEPADIATLKGKTGVIVIKVTGWSDATGHATLWDGSNTGDNTHYQDINYDGYNDKVKPLRILFWELK